MLPEENKVQDKNALTEEEDEPIDVKLVQTILDNLEAKFNGDTMPWTIEARIEKATFKKSKKLKT